MDCQNAQLGASWSFDDYASVWEASEPVINCNAGEPAGKKFSPEQIAALDAAGYDRTTVALGFLYARCADLGTDDPPTGYWPSAYAALTLCPEHPDAAAVIARADEAIAAETEAAAAEAAERAAAEKSVAQRVQEIEDGTRILGGIHRVGEGIESGTYVSEGDIENCYWERLDNTGAIIENGFHVSALRIEVAIGVGDYSFSSQRCGEWIRVG
ncbi:hypothetical protein D9V29_13980 [Mycetocola manganoxydans]|uniref:Uncharacterized protein n=2 Tax=Mycetocola manganoxydans TaxID=699879 RepID=A0A3L6ZLD9_9MICO|nr:hypothetical protein [Mycetocola manganoxydans]RLP68331.1 hypothetical protein D9V29_13980 [Mycetocola manganoxydans]